MTDGSNYIYWAGHSVRYRVVESLCCTPIMNTTLYANYTSMKIKKKKVGVTILHPHKAGLKIRKTAGIKGALNNECINSPEKTILHVYAPHDRG